MLFSSIQSSSIMLIDLAYALIMLGLGVAAGIWLKRGTAAPASAERQRAKLELSKLRELASSVARGVGEHSTRVQEISSELSAQPGGSAGGDVIRGSVAEILKANEQLQQKLATAEVKLQRQAAELETQVAVARTDALTGLYNRRAFDDELTRRCSEHHRRKTIFCLLMLDVDHFKKFNDAHGHQTGDEVLRGVAQVLSRTMREMDLVTRYGGEEFGVILPITNLAEGLRAAERARSAVAASTFEHDGNHLRVTMSIGVAQIHDADSAASIVRRADAALYGAKAAGRDRVYFHDGQECFPAGQGPAFVAPDKPGERLALPTANNSNAPSGVAAEPASEPAKTVRGIESYPSIQEFCNELRGGVIQCQQHGAPLSLMLVDVDEFDVLSEKRGAAVGELILRSMAEFLDAALNELDVVSRFGSGRFAVMMPGTTLADAAHVGEHVRSAVAACTMQVKGSELRFTVSLGLAEASAADDPAALIKKADAALFSSKAAGRNCSHAHNGQHCEPVHALAAC